ncbi:short-chain dehydrogenase [Thozetella sp. PMI_491]|nr:short-chain dehydrogenase [Thozetella sp. PMI_491]
MSSSIELGPAPSSFRGQFVRSLLISQPEPPSNLDLGGQTGIITGGNSGLGFECAHTLLAYKLSRLIITVRDEDKGRDAVSKLKSVYPTAEIEAWSLDMLSYKSIQSFSQRCADLNRIDFAILNAGMKNSTFIVNESTKHEVVFQVNYLSTVLLALLLLPVIKKRRPLTKPGRLTMVGSGLALAAKFPEQSATRIIPAFDDPTGWGFQASFERYSTTKLLLLMFLVKLKDYVNPDDVVVNVADPGFMRNAGLDRHLPTAMRAAFGLYRSVGRSTKAGAWTYVDAATVKPPSSHGSWTYNWTVYPFPSMMHTPEGKSATERLWKETIKELEFADVQNILSSIRKSV